MVEKAACQLSAVSCQRNLIPSLRSERLKKQWKDCEEAAGKLRLLGGAALFSCDKALFSMRASESAEKVGLQSEEQPQRL
jgi:hypothetical protein